MIMIGFSPEGLLSLGAGYAMKEKSEKKWSLIETQLLFHRKELWPFGKGFCGKSRMINVSVKWHSALHSFCGSSGCYCCIKEMSTQSAPFAVCYP